MGRIVLAGGAEFSGRMRDLDLRALDQAGGLGTVVQIITAAAAPDNNQDRAGARGVDWFRSLGAIDVVCRGIVDPATADDPREAESLLRADLIYLLGGFPAHLAETLQHSISWRAAVRACNSGAVIAGSSAGAMVLGELFYDPAASKLRPGLGLIGSTLVIPHHERSSSSWAPRLESLAPDSLLLGLDESTGIIDDTDTGGWTVYGEGEAVVYLEGQLQRFSSGGVIPFDLLPPPRVDRQNSPW